MSSYYHATQNHNWSDIKVRLSLIYARVWYLYKLIYLYCILKINNCGMYDCGC